MMKSIHLDLWLLLHRYYSQDDGHYLVLELL